MSRWTAPILSLALLLPAAVGAIDGVRLEIGSIEGAGWRAHGVRADYRLSGELRLQAETVEVAGAAPARSLQLDCSAPARKPRLPVCHDGRLRGHHPLLGAIRTQLYARLEGTHRWQLRLEGLHSPAAKAEMLAMQRRDGDTALRWQAAELDLARLPPALWADTGIADYRLQGQAQSDGTLRQGGDGALEADYRLRLAPLDFQSPDGLHAAEGLILDIRGGVTSEAAPATSGLQLDARLGIDGGQHYRDPVFNDFSLQPARASVSLHAGADGILLQQLEIDQPGVLRARLRTGGRAQVPRQAPEQKASDDRDAFPAKGPTSPDAAEAGAKAQKGPAAGAATDGRSGSWIWPAQALLELEEFRLPAAAERYLAPFAVGTRFEPARSSGRLHGWLVLRQGQPVAARLDAESVSFVASKAGAEPGSATLDVRDLSGTLHWSATAPVPDSRLRWQHLGVRGLPLGAAEARLRLHDRSVALLAPLRLPLFDGGLAVRELALAGIGEPGLSARFAAEVEPLSLEALTEALGWPRFGGVLSGELPGLRLQGGNLLLEGGLQAKIFDGRLNIERLRILDIFGVVPRLAADLHLRRLDLLALTRAFSFGTITGRLDGDIEGLRLLGGEAVAFDAALYSTPGDRSRRRISQRAIDNISAAGGGPRGVLSGGFLRFFSDFPYARIGWRCRLRNGVCTMGGIGPHPKGGFLLVEGRGLPHIEVVGHGRKVDWPTFVSQLRNTTYEGASASDPGSSQ